MTSQVLTPPSYSRLRSAPLRETRPEPRPTRTQSALEITLFTVFGATLVLCAVALIAINSPSHGTVPNRVAEGLAAGRVNLLVIGTDGSSGTESLTMVSLKPRTHQVAMISIPRDLWVRVGHYGSHRLAAAMSIGQSSGYPGEGPGLLTDTVEGVVGQPIHAFVTLDPASLRTAVDAVGGIDVDVQHPFFESSARHRFTAGEKHLNGRLAILYAQSLSVPGPEGSRFSRARRQQQVIAALLERVGRSTPAARGRIAAAFVKLGQPSPRTNLAETQIDELCGAFAGNPAVVSATLERLVDPFPVKSLLEDAGEAMRPRAGDWAGVQTLTREIFAQTPVATLR